MKDSVAIEAIEATLLPATTRGLLLRRGKARLRRLRRRVCQLLPRPPALGRPRVGARSVAVLRLCLLSLVSCQLCLPVRRRSPLPPRAVRQARGRRESRGIGFRSRRPAVRRLLSSVFRLFTRFRRDAFSPESQCRFRGGRNTQMKCGHRAPHRCLLRIHSRLAAANIFDARH